MLATGALYAARAAPAANSPSAALSITPTPLINQGIVDSPDISTIDNPTPSCMLPKRGTDICYLSWPYLSVNADTNYMITMTVGIDGKSRARFNGFFQNSMYVPSEMLSFRVACGVAGTGGDPDWGLSHSYVIRARDSAGLKSSNTGTVYCPADQVSLITATLSGPDTGLPWQDYTFSVESAPITATMPVTYNWQVSGYPELVDVGGLNIDRTFTWNSIGTKSLQVTIDNPASSLVLSRTIQIHPYYINLPLLFK
jgi:hypothetical protein